MLNLAASLSAAHLPFRRLHFHYSSSFKPSVSHCEDKQMNHRTPAAQVKTRRLSILSNRDHTAFWRLLSQALDGGVYVHDKNQKIHPNKAIEIKRY